MLSSASPLALFSLIILPVALVATSFISLLLDALIQQYTHRLETSYAGYQGRLTVSSDVETVRTLHAELTQKDIAAYPRSTRPSLIFLSTESRNIVKFVELVVLKDRDFANKFRGVGTEKLVVNQIFSSQLGGYFDRIELIRLDAEQPWAESHGFELIDTGFLTNNALAFVAQSRLIELLPDDIPAFTQLEVADANTLNIHAIKSRIFDLVEKRGLDSVRLNDLFEETSEARKQFSSLRIGQQVMLALTIFLAVYAVTTSTALLLDLKTRTLGILSRLGLDRADIAIAICSMGYMLFVMSLVFSYLLFEASYLSALAIIVDVNGFEYTLNPMYGVIVVIMFVWFTLRACLSAYRVELSAP